MYSYTAKSEIDYSNFAFKDGDTFSMEAGPNLAETVEFVGWDNSADSELAVFRKENGNLVRLFRCEMHKIFTVSGVC